MFIYSTQSLVLRPSQPTKLHIREGLSYIICPLVLMFIIYMFYIMPNILHENNKWIIFICMMGVYVNYLHNKNIRNIVNVDQSAEEHQKLMQIYNRSFYRYTNMYIYIFAAVAALMFFIKYSNTLHNIHDYVNIICGITIALLTCVFATYKYDAIQTACNASLMGGIMMLLGFASIFIVTILFLASAIDWIREFAKADVHNNIYINQLRTCCIYYTLCTLIIVSIFAHHDIKFATLPESLSMLMNLIKYNKINILRYTLQLLNIIAIIYLLKYVTNKDITHMTTRIIIFIILSIIDYILYKKITCNNTAIHRIKITPAKSI